MGYGSWARVMGLRMVGLPEFGLRLGLFWAKKAEKFKTKPNCLKIHIIKLNLNLKSATIFGIFLKGYTRIKSREKYVEVMVE